MKNSEIFVWSMISGAGAVALLAVLYWMGAIVDMFISLVDIV